MVCFQCAVKQYFDRNVNVIIFCPLHAAAEETAKQRDQLLEALADAYRVLRNATPLFAPQYLLATDRLLKKCEAAIAAADQIEGVVEKIEIAHRQRVGTEVAVRDPDFIWVIPVREHVPTLRDPDAQVVLRPTGLDFETLGAQRV